MKKSLILGLCIVILCSILALPLLLRPQSPPENLQKSVEKAISYFRASTEPNALLWLDVMHRRFGITGFADALQRYDQELEKRPEQAPLMRVFRRIADYDNQLQSGDLQSVSAETDSITVPALYCDRMEFPDSYPSKLVDGIARGNYLLTHVLLAWIWIQENGCELGTPEGFVENLYQSNAALINGDSVVTDLELEAAAFLYLGGKGSLVSGAFVERVIATQTDDGGWLLSSNESGSSNWHPTVLALLLLLHVEYPAGSYSPMLADRSA